MSWTARTVASGRKRKERQRALQVVALLLKIVGPFHFQRVVAVEHRLIYFPPYGKTFGLAKSLFKYTNFFDKN